MSLLATAESLTFKELRDLLDMTDGNLSVHMRTLEEAGYVSVQKEFVDRRPRTTYALTEAGRTAFTDYIGTLEAIVAQSRAVEPARRQGQPEGGRPLRIRRP